MNPKYQKVCTEIDKTEKKISGPAAAAQGTARQEDRDGKP